MSGILIGLIVWAVVLAIVVSVLLYQNRKIKISMAFLDHQNDVHMERLKKLQSKHNRTGTRKGRK